MTLAATAHLLVAAVGAGVGALLRWQVLSGVGRAGWPGGTAWVNVPASAVAGGLVVLGAHGAVLGWLLWFALAVCGGLSTYSSLALELAVALRDRDRPTLLAGVAGVGAGLAAGLAGAAGALAARAS